MRYFTCSWTADEYDRCAEEVERTGVTEPIISSYGSGFLAAGVAPGDQLYILNWHEGQLSVLGRMLVGSVLTREDASAQIDLEIDAAEVVLAEVGGSTLLVFDAVLNGPDIGEDDELVDMIEFVEADGSLAGPARGPDGAIEPQTFRDVREVTDDTASLFDVVLGFDRDQGFAADDSTVQRLVAIDFFDGDDSLASLDVLVEAPALLDRWTDEDIESPPQEVLEDPERLGPVLMEAVQRWAASEEAAVLTGLDEVVDQIRMGREDD